MELFLCEGQSALSMLEWHFDKDVKVNNRRFIKSMYLRALSELSLVKTVPYVRI